ncbi:MAG: hypothetical protein HQL03_07165 [Nitrospirae bacterium]|nr:hypothetical protein [Nitrospirota bacterium]
MDIVFNPIETCYIIGQPLLLSDFIYKYIDSSGKIPTEMLIIEGGYLCPVTLENFTKDILIRSNCQTEILHAYGVAEVDAGCFMGMDRNSDGDIIYYIVTDNIKAVLRDGKLLLHQHDMETNEERLFDTDEFAKEYNDGLLIQNKIERLNPDIVALFDSFDNNKWRRYTGYVAMINNNYHMQLRSNVLDCTTNEIEFWEFCKLYGYTWLNKPNWS